jgi:iron-sulfur cluster repair protein YtfE (RIC family)
MKIHYLLLFLKKPIRIGYHRRLADRFPRLLRQANRISAVTADQWGPREINPKLALLGSAKLLLE